MLYDFCKVIVSEYDDFVGLKFVDNNPSVTFPRGYKLSTDEKTVRNDIIRLLSVIQKFSGVYEGNKNNSKDGENNLSFPILSYQYIINDFLSNGYYIENEVSYTSNTRGKINWKRTIQKKQPIFNNGNLVYIDFIVKQNKINANNLITLIHEYCVRDSFEKLGWLYLSSNTLPKKPEIKFNKKLFLSVLNDALNNTFNNSKKMLFISMINVIKNSNESVDSLDNVAFGVNRFEHVWEKLIDYAFGEDNKDKFFPHASWHIIDGNSVVSSALEPDTIMLYKDKLFILDAKYYKYGITKNAKHLPATASIHKQITYGEYIDAQPGFEYEKNNIYNAFIMPFNSNAADVDDVYKFVSIGMADWKIYNASTSNYNYVLGILLDTRFIINSYVKHNYSEIERLSNLIVESLAQYRKNANEK